MDAVLCMFAGRVYFCRYCYVMVCYVQVRVRSSSSGCMYGVHGVAAVEAAGPSPWHLPRWNSRSGQARRETILCSEAGVYVCMAGAVVVTQPYLSWPGWHRRELDICQEGSWVRSLPQGLLILLLVGTHTYNQPLRGAPHAYHLPCS